LAHISQLKIRKKGTMAKEEITEQVPRLASARPGGKGASATGKRGKRVNFFPPLHKRIKSPSFDRD